MFAIPSELRSSLPSYFRFTNDRAGHFSVNEIVQRAIVWFHTTGSSVTAAPLSSTVTLPSEELSGLIGQIESASLRVFGSDEDPISNTEKLAHLLAALMVGAPTARLQEIFSDLDEADKRDLIRAVDGVVPRGAGAGAGQAVSGEDIITEDPSVLLRLTNREGLNVLEALLEARYLTAYLQREVAALEGATIEQIESRPAFSLMCYLIWWKEGGRSNPSFGEWGYGERRLRENPTLLHEIVTDEFIQEFFELGEFAEGTVRAAPSANKISFYLEFCDRFSHEIDIRRTGQLYASIEDEDLKYILVSRYAQINATHTVQNITSFKIDDQSRLEELARICAREDADTTPRYIHNFGIKNLTALAEIAKICAAKNGAATAYYIQNFGIKDPIVLAEIAKICEEQMGVSTERYKPSVARYIGNFGITNQAALVEIAKVCARHNPCEMAKNIQNFGIIDPLARFEIAKICATQNGEETASRIQNFAITDQAALAEVAIACAVQMGRMKGAFQVGIVDFIEKFGIDDEKSLLAIAKVSAELNSDLTASQIQKFHFQNQASLVEVAKVCAMRRGSRIAEHIMNFGIEKEEDRIAIAMLCAEHGGASLPLHIKNFRITEDKGALVEIAKVSAAQSGSRIAEHIMNFGIEKEEDRIAIAMLSAEHGGASLPLYIKNFQITEDKGALVEIAKVSAAQRESHIAEHIMNFGIEKEQDRVLIAMLCAEHAGVSLPPHINKFQITEDQRALVEIAKICAAKNAAGTVPYINLFGIRSERQLVEIAKLCLQQNAHAVACHIRQFGIVDQASLVEIAKLCVKKDAPNVKKFILKFGIIDQAALMEIARICAGGDPYLAVQYIREFWITDKAVLLEMSNAYLDAFIEEKHREFLHQMAEIYPSTPREAWERLALEHKKELLRIKDMLSLGFIKASECRNQQLRIYLVEMLALHIKYEKSVAAYEMLITKKAAILQPLLRIMIIVASWAKREEEDVESLSKEMTSLQNAVWQHREAIKNASIHLEFSLLNLEAALSGSPLSFKERIHLMAHCAELSGKDPLQFKKICDMFTILQKVAYFSSGWPASLKRDFSIRDVENELLKKVQNSLFFIEEDLLAAYFEMSCKQRWPFALELYASRIDDPEAKKEMSRFINSILKGTFVRERYALEGNLHAQALASCKIKEEDDESIWDKWQKMVSCESTIAGAGAGAGAGAAAREERHHTLPSGLGQVQISDDWEDLFLCGTEVLSGCQSIDAKPETSKCLLGYCMDGKVKMLTIKDPSTGRMLVRAQLKLLVKMTGDKIEPVLFLETIYPLPSEEQLSAMNSAAKKCARDLGVSLYSRNPNIDLTGAFERLESLGSPSPWEYEDAGGLGVTRGVYAIGAKRVPLD